MRVQNFFAGPSTLPLSVLEQAQAACVDWEGKGLSVMEISHRSDAFMALAAQTTEQIRRLLSVPKTHHILWMTGGARLQYAAVPLNMGRGRIPCFVDTGFWSQTAMQEAQRLGKAHCVATAADAYDHVPDPATWQMLPADEAAYLHVVDNETVHGVEYATCPDAQGLPLVSDMTSNILSRPVDVSQYALIYASTQKNMGPAGLTLVMVHEDHVGHALPHTPTLLDYQTFVKTDSLYNTPPTWTWYVLSLMLSWTEEQGGVAAMAKQNAAKSQRLYDYLDQSDFYRARVRPGGPRSRMNAVFELPDDALQAAFLTEAERQSLVGLKGHAALGGLRASLYNAMTMAGVEALIEMMEGFRYAN